MCGVRVAFRGGGVGEGGVREWCGEAEGEWGEGRVVGSLRSTLGEWGKR